MNIQLFRSALITLFLAVCCTAAHGNTKDSGGISDQETAEASRAAYESLIEDAEVQRTLATEAAVEAEIMAQEKQVEEESRQAQQKEAQVAEEAREEAGERARLEAIKAEELKQIRNELSQTHRELQETSRRVAQAHRKLAIASSPGIQYRYFNLGDRAVLGVVLGFETQEGIQVMGVSPGGPAEKAGLMRGDRLVALDGTPLVRDEQQSGRDRLFDLMDKVSDGDEIELTVRRESENLDLIVTVERREPTSWQSMIEIPTIPSDVAGIEDIHTIVRKIRMPELDEERLVEELAELEETVREIEVSFESLEGFDEVLQGGWAFEMGDMSQFGIDAMRDADAWFGLPLAHGLELTALNPSLGRYFDTERGVLVINIDETNDYHLMAGDVILRIGSDDIDSPSDFMRKIRKLNSGEQVSIEIKREKRTVTLDVIIPENRLGYHMETHRNEE